MEQEPDTGSTPLSPVALRARVASFTRQVRILQEKLEASEEALLKARQRATMAAEGMDEALRKLADEQQANGLLADKLRELLESQPEPLPFIPSSSADMISMEEHLQKVSNQGGLIAALKGDVARLERVVELRQSEAREAAGASQRWQESAGKAYGLLRAIIWNHGTRDGESRFMVLSELDEMAGTDLLVVRKTEKPPVREYRVSRRDNG